jgi:RNA polymerase-interacting CarD/CdnL/TRCF family regulator
VGRGVAAVEVAGFRVGERVVCPKCGKEGVVAIERVGAKGHRYAYVAIRHYGPPEWRARKCYIMRVEGGAAPSKPAAPQAAAKPREPVEARAVAEPSGQVPSVPEPQFDEREFDRIAWYITKFNIAWGAVRAAPSEETYQAFVSVARQVQDRVGVDTSTAVAAVTKFYAERSKDATIAATTAVKEVVKQMVAKMAGAVEVPAKPVEVPRSAVDVEEIRAIVREEVERVVSAVMSEIASRMMEKEEIEEVVVDKVTYDVVQKVFRGKHKTSQEERRQAYEVWEKIFREGRKIVDVRR